MSTAQRIQISFFLVVLPVSLLLAGCGRSPRYHTEAKPGVDLGAYKSFAVLPVDGTIPGVDRTVVEHARPVVINPIRATLIAKGYVEAPAEEADFVVAINAPVMPQPRYRELGYTPAYEGSGWYAGNPDLAAATAAAPGDDEDALVALQAYDGKTKELVWFSLTASIRREHGSNLSRIARSRDLALRLISEFPTQEANR